MRFEFEAEVYEENTFDGTRTRRGTVALEGPTEEQARREFVNQSSRCGVWVRRLELKKLPDSPEAAVRGDGYRVCRRCGTGVYPGEGCECGEIQPE